MTSTITTTQPIAVCASTSNDDIRLQSLEDHSEQDSTPIRLSDDETNWDTREGWAVVAAGSAIFFVFLGLIYSYGIVQLHLTESRLASISTLSLIGSAGAAITPLTGIIIARIIKLTGYRVTALIGSSFLGLGEFTAGWSTKSVPAMFVTRGLWFGIGSSMLFLPAATVPSLWFKRKRGLATGVVFGGAGIGSAVISISMEKLIVAVGLESALKILGALAWATCVTASYFLRAPAGRGRAVSSVQWRLFRSAKFNMMLVRGTIATFPLFVPPFLLPLYVLNIGFSGQAAAAILACWNIASAPGRIGMGFGADTYLGPVHSLFLSLTVTRSFTLRL